jgi:hypothetical protein
MEGQHSAGGRLPGHGPFGNLQRMAPPTWEIVRRFIGRSMQSDPVAEGQGAKAGMNISGGLLTLAMPNDINKYYGVCAFCSEVQYQWESVTL